MKRILPLILVLCLSPLAEAQLFTYGPTAGVGYSTFRRGDNVSPGATSFMVGVHARVKLLGLYVQPGLNYQYLNSGDDTPFTSSRLDVPLQLGIKVLMFDIHTGPVLNLPLSGSIDDIDIADDLNASSYSWQVGAGIELFSLKLGLRYQGSVTDVVSDDATGDPTRWRNVYAYIEYQF